MIDQMQALERAAEDRMLEMSAGMPDGYFRCGCGQPEELSHAVPSSESPYAEPMCRGCFRLAKVEARSTTESRREILPRG